MGQIEFNGRGYALAATAGAMRRIEQASELTLPEIFQAHVAHRLTLEEAAAIVTAGMEAHQVNSSSFGSVLDELFARRLTDKDIRLAIGGYLAELLYHPTDTKNLEAAMKFLAPGGLDGDQPM